MTKKELYKKHGISRQAVRARMQKGMSFDEALVAPKEHRKGSLLGSIYNVKQYEAWGEKKTLRQWTEDKRCRVNYHVLYDRIKKGTKIEDAISKEKMCNSNKGTGV